MNFYELNQILENNYPQQGWVTAQELSKVNFHIGHMSIQQVYINKTQAEKMSDLEGIKNHILGRATVIPVKIINIISDKNGLIQAKIQVIGPPELTEDAKKEQNKVKYLTLFEIRGYISGHHGYGDEPEMPAGDPRGNAEWEPQIDEIHLHKIEHILKNQEIVVQGNGNGSYHERWFEGKISVAIELEQSEALIQMGVSVFSGNLDRKIKVLSRFPFTNMQEIIEKSAEIMEVPLPGHDAYGYGDKPPVWYKPGMTSKDYWDKQIEIEKLKKPKNWSGD